MQCCDMLVNLSTLPAPASVAEDVWIKRAWAGDLEEILRFIRETFSAGWASETCKAVLQNPSTCFLATHKGKLIGFACYDATTKGFFGPTGISEPWRGQGIGKALLLRTLYAMEEAGYGYAIIGWVGDAKGFYKKAAGAIEIPNSDPDHSVYKNRIATY